MHASSSMYLLYFVCSIIVFYYCAIGIYVTGNVWNQAFYECLDKNSQAFCRMPEYLRYSYTETILITHEGPFKVHACH